MLYTDRVAEDLDKDLGLGGRLGEQNQARLLNRDGSFHVRRVGGSLNIYHHLLTISWLRFHVLVLLVYVVVNLVFAGGYLLCGPGALSGADAPTMGGWVQNAFFFSVQTLATIGYGKMTPEIVLPINEASQLHGWTEEQWLSSQAEVYILLADIDETFTQQVHSSSSYQAGEMVWGAKFRDIYGEGAGPDSCASPRACCTSMTACSCFKGYLSG